MPFDVGDFPGASFSDRAASRPNRRVVAGWLFIVAAMILVMIGLGGATRLTGSGLSIMEWAPLRGTLPPLGEAEWNRLFRLYQQIPQYTLLNPDMDLEGFKRIFWLEWIHRAWGRLIGVVFLVPLIWFWVTGRITRRMLPKLLLLFVLGGLQGVIGWLMVASGFFPDATAVSPYRLVVHLSLALILYGAVLWMGLSILRPVAATDAGPAYLRPCAMVCLGLLSLTILAGGFVAGIHAGLDYNTFPLMDGHLVPEGYVGSLPFLRNLTENVAAVQFNHRLLATLTAAAVLATIALGLSRRGSRDIRVALLALLVTTALQYGIGVVTLLWIVPVSLGTAHQVGATVLLTALLYLLHGLRRPRLAGNRG